MGGGTCKTMGVLRRPRLNRKKKLLKAGGSWRPRPATAGAPDLAQAIGKQPQIPQQGKQGQAHGNNGLEDGKQDAAHRGGIPGLAAEGTGSLAIGWRVSLPQYRLLAFHYKIRG